MMTNFQLATNFIALSVTPTKQSIRYVAATQTGLASSAGRGGKNTGGRRGMTTKRGSIRVVAEEEVAKIAVVAGAVVGEVEVVVELVPIPVTTPMKNGVR
jgi:hypothetical protein